MEKNHRDHHCRGACWPCWKAAPEEARRLRQSSPFCGILTPEEERQAIFRKYENAPRSSTSCEPLGEIAGEDEFILLGSQSVLGAFPDAPLALRRSIELDIYPKHHPEKSELIDGAIGERSLCFLHETHGYYAHGGVAPEKTARLPAGWENRTGSHQQ